MSESRIHDLVVISTVREGHPDDEIERARAEVALDTALQLSSFGLISVWLYHECSEAFLEKLRKNGVVLIKQSEDGFGAVRREVLRRASEMFPHTPYFAWIEPEKPHIVPDLFPMVAQMRKKGAVLGQFNRSSMLSYPPEQAYCYLVWRLIATYLIGYDLDLGFGPVVIHRSVVSYFLDYQSSNGDVWDAFLVPRMRIIKDGFPFVAQKVDFENDPRMTQIERGNPIILSKRLRQLDNVSRSFVSEWFK